MKAQASKLLKLTDDFLIAAVEEEVASIRERIAKVQKEKLDLQARLADLNREIAEIEAMPIEADKNWVNISDEELEQIYHKTLEKIEYYPISLMKGFYKIVYKGGAELTIAVSKVRSNPKAYILNDANVDYSTGDITIRYTTYESKEGFLAPQAVNNEAQVNILDKDLFYSELFEMACLELAIATDYRTQSQTEVYEAARTDK
jgi:site-specific DNA recombinase